MIFVRFVSRRQFMPFDQAELRNGKNHGERHDSEGFERHPRVGRKISPDNFIEQGEHDKKHGPSPR